MPWQTVTDELSGHRRIYVPSAWAKEELPTWDELYNKFYVGENFVYDPDKPEDQEPDQYWKIPWKKVLIAQVCNQLNKMLFEDGYWDKLIEYLKARMARDVWDVRFVIVRIPSALAEMERVAISAKDIKDVIPDAELAEEAEKCLDTISRSMFMAFQHFREGQMMRMNCRKKMPPAIYTIPNPNGTPNPFAQPSILRKSIPERTRLQIDCVIASSEPLPIERNIERDPLTIIGPDTIDPRVSWMDIIRFMLKDVIEYFGGEGVGWKDDEGHLIEGLSPKRLCEGMGSDPAL